MNNLIDFPEKLFFKIGIVPISLGALALLIIGFLAVLLISLIKSGYGVKKRLWFVALSVGVTALVYTATSLLGQGKGWFLLVFSLSALLCVPVFILPEKRVKFEESHRSFVRYIDGQIKRQEEQIQTPSTTLCKECTENLRVEKEPTERKDLKDFELDFLHVKSVIQRLEYYGLSQADKKLVKDLEQAICLAENGDYSIQVKNRINDGLGALLKIMSKYGV